MEVFLNGSFLPAEEAHISIFDHGFLYGDGVYETLRTVEGELIDPGIHFERLTRSAELLRLPLLISYAELLAATQELLKRNGFTPEKEARLRWSLTRGVNNFEFSGARSPTFLITAVPLADYPQEYLQEGVAVCTLEVYRILPEAKTTSLLPMILGKQRATDTGSFECIFIENGFLTEGTVSNFFIQVGKDMLTVPPEKALPGTAARRFREKLSGAGFKFREKFFTLEEALAADAAFLTNSLFGVLAVKSLNAVPLGAGKTSSRLPEVLTDFWK